MLSAIVREGEGGGNDNDALHGKSQKKPENADAGAGGRRRRRSHFDVFKSKLLRRSQDKPLSEARLRKRVRRHAERGDWEAVRKLLSDYEFSDVPEDVLSKQQQHPQSKQAPEGRGHKQDRRPSYGSRGGDRRRFSGNESAAAAAVIQAAFLEDISDSSADLQRPDFGENVLHDLCRCGPPSDVLESALASLRRRPGSAVGTDGRGRTPLHVAAACGGSAEVVDALVRADPCAASMGDADGRSPLHLATMYLSQDGNSATDAPASSYQSVLILKDAMITYPGKIGFKDEDKLGYSPLDYAIDNNIAKGELVQALQWRKVPPKSRLTSSFTSPSLWLARRRSTQTTQGSHCESQDIEMLRRLEQDEIDARRGHIQKMKARRREEREETAESVLYDAFGIEASSPSDPAAGTNRDDVYQEHQPPTDAEEWQASSLDVEACATDADIYNRHLQDYFDDYMDDFECYEDLETEDGFDIMDDPSLATSGPILDDLAVLGTTITMRPHWL
ncbi:hypothetical protein ACHAWF_005698 [Thalassiosira exigua]